MSNNDKILKWKNEDPDWIEEFMLVNNVDGNNIKRIQEAMKEIKNIGDTVNYDLDNIKCSWKE